MASFKVRNYLGAVVILLGSVIAAQAGEKRITKIIDNTNTTFGWQVLKDKPPMPTLEVISGPDRDTKALQLKYEFTDGVWLAMVKDLSLAIGPSDGVVFYYKGSGAAANLKVKFADSTGTVFGYQLPESSISSTWKKVIIPRSAFMYLYGGPSGGSINWENVSKCEITLDVVDKEKAGRVAFHKFEISDASGVSVPVPAAANAGGGAAPEVAAPAVITAVKEMKPGLFSVHAMNNPTGWTTMADQDGKIALSSKVVVVDKKTSQAVKANFDFGSKGVWNAMILNAPANLSNLQYLAFSFRGEGGANLLLTKLTDVDGTVFVYTVEHPTNAKEWKTVKIPKESFKYSYGGSSNGNIKWDQIQKFELTFEKKDDANPSGVVFFRRLMYKVQAKK